MVASDHPRVRGGSISVAELGAERHILVDGPSGHVGPKLALQSLELLDRVALQVAKFSVLPYLVQGSELVAIVPEYLGHTYAASHSVRLLRLPIDLEPIDVALYARPERSRSPAQRWLVGFVRKTLTDVESPLSAQSQADNGM